MNQQIAVILSKHRHPTPAQGTLFAQLLGGLQRRAELAVTVTAHLYDLVPEGPAVQRLRAIAGDLIVLGWLYPRAAYWMLDAHGVRRHLAALTEYVDKSQSPRAATRGLSGATDRTLWCFDLRADDRAETYLAAIDGIVSGRLGRVSVPGEAVAGREGGVVAGLDEATRPRWYPVVDYDRCNNCLECLNFCLFGVYGLDAAGAIAVEQPDACRPGCPACARVCPQAAIMFPQHNDPAIAGDPKASLTGLKLDLSQLLSGMNPSDVAAAERARAAAERERSAVQAREKKPGPAESLDSLVDGLDRLEL